MGSHCLELCQRTLGSDRGRILPRAVRVIHCDLLAELEWVTSLISLSLSSLFSFHRFSLQLWKNWEDALNSMCEEVEACDGATELVEALSHLSSCTTPPQPLPMGIATSSRMAGVLKKKVRHDRIFQPMQVIVAGDDPAVIEGKPAPDIYLEAARRLNLPPQECLVFEDALSGVRAGKAAGCWVVAIPDHRFTNEEKEAFAVEADVVLESLWQFDGSPFGIDIKLQHTTRSK